MKIETNGQSAGLVAVTQVEARAMFRVDDPTTLAREYLRTQQFDGAETLRFWKGSWWEWREGAYRPVEFREFKARLQRFIRGHVESRQLRDGNHHLRGLTNGLVSNVLGALEAEVVVDGEVDMPSWLAPDGSLDTERRSRYGHLALRNGIVRLDSLLDGGATPMRLTPRWFSRVVLPYDYEPKARCPRWHAFLKEVLEGDEERIAFLQEFAGYCLIPTAKFQKFAVLEGVGANGKGVVISVLTQMLGPDNVAHVPLERFAERFQLCDVIGKLANFAPEVDVVPPTAIGTLKSFTAGDRLTVDRKHLNPISFVPTAKLVLATNERLKFHDRSNGIYRRLVVLPFRVEIPPERQDPALAERLCEELPGIFNWAVRGLKRLLEKNRFTRPSISEAEVASYRAEANPELAFLSEECRESVGGSVPVDDLYQAYVNYCAEAGTNPRSKAELGQEVKRRFPSVERKRRPTGDRGYFYQGLALTGVHSNSADLNVGGAKNC